MKATKASDVILAGGIWIQFYLLLVGRIQEVFRKKTFSGIRNKSKEKKAKLQKKGITLKKKGATLKKKEQNSRKKE